MGARSWWVVVALAVLTCSNASADEKADYQKNLRVGDLAFWYSDYSKAEDFYRQAALDDPKQALPELKMGRLDYTRGRYAAAEQRFKKALSLKKDEATKRFLEDVVHQIDTNRSLLVQIEAADPTDVGALLGLHRRAAQAMAEPPVYIVLLAPHLEFVLRADPNNRQILRLLADGYYGSAEFFKARAFYEKILNLSKGGLDLFERLAECSINLGDYDRARLVCKKGLREAVRVSSTQGIKKFSKWLGSLPRSSRQIASLVEEEKFDDAYKALKRILALNPSDSWAMTRMGFVMENIGQNGQAERLYREAIQNHPEDPAPHFYLGDYYLLKKKEYEKALDEFERFREGLQSIFWNMGPNAEKDMHANLAAATLDIAYIQGEILKNPPAAVRELETFLQSEPNNARVWYNLGVFYANSKKKMSAYRAFQKVIALEPDSELSRQAKEAIELLRNLSETGNQYADPYS